MKTRYLITLLLMVFSVTNSYADKLNDLHKMGFNDAQIIQATLLGEARGEGKLGMSAVYTVIYNRSLDKMMMAQKEVNMSEICLQPNQFSFWNKMQSKYYYDELLNSKEGKDALDIVVKRLRLNLQSRFYCHVKCNASWKKSAILEKVIGNHAFYCL
jgi:hypothetical protein